MDNIIIGLYNLAFENWGAALHLLIVFFLVILTRMNKISEYKIAQLGLSLLGITVILSIARQDDIAGNIAGYVWILLTYSFIVQAMRNHKYD